MVILLELMGCASLMGISPQEIWTSFLQEPSAWMLSFTGAFTMTSTACMATPWQEPQTCKHLVPPNSRFGELVNRRFLLSSLSIFFKCICDYQDLVTQILQAI